MDPTILYFYVTYKGQKIQFYGFWGILVSENLQYKGSK